MFLRTRSKRPLQRLAWASLCTSRPRPCSRDAETTGRARGRATAGTQRPLLGGGVQSGVVRFRVTGPRLRRDPLGRRHWSPLRKIQERVSERTRRRDKTALPCAGWRWRERLPGAARLPGPARLPRSRPPRAPSSPRKKPMLRSWTYLIRRREHERSRQGHPDEAVGNRRVSLPVPRVAPPPARRRPHCASRH